MGGSAAGGGGNDRDPFRNNRNRKGEDNFRSNGGSNSNGNSSGRIKRIASGMSLSACEATVASSVSDQNAAEGAMALTRRPVDQRQRLNSQAFHLSIASGASAGILVLYTVPAQLLVGMAMVFALFASLMFTLYRRAVLEYNAVVRGQGVGDVLPESIFEQLVNMSLHDWMIGSESSTTFFQEYGFVLLYFVPGLSRQQIDAYVDRLNPGHRAMLRRRGLGHFLGHGFMRVLLGDERLNTIQEASHGDPDQVPVIHQATPSTRFVPRRLDLQHRAIDDDETSELGVEDSDVVRSSTRRRRNTSHGGRDVAIARSPPTQIEGDSTAQILRSIARSSAVAQVSRAAVLSSRAAAVAPDASSETPSSDDDDEEEEEEDSGVNELGILADAFTASVVGYSNMAVGSVVGTARSMASSAFNLLAGTATRASLTITFMSTGIGLFGMWAGVYDINRLSGNVGAPRAPLRIPATYQQYFPSASLLWNTSMASSAASSVFMMFGLGGMATSRPSKSNSKSRTNKQHNRKQR